MLTINKQITQGMACTTPVLKDGCDICDLCEYLHQDVEQTGQEKAVFIRWNSRPDRIDNLLCSVMVK